MRFLFLIFLLVSSQIYSQTIVWEKSFNIPDDQRFVAIAEADSGYMCLGQGEDPTDFCEILKLDTGGNLLWRKPLGIGNSTSISGDMVKVPNENNYYVLGAFSNGGFTNDFVTKINSIGDTLWTYVYAVGAIYQTFYKMIVLQDKSVLSVGFQQQSGTGEDVFVRRLDSLGNLMWQKMYPISGSQRAFDITEMLDGSLMISGREGNNHIVLRIDFDGKLINSTTINISNGTPRLNLVRSDHSNNVIFTGYDYVSSTNFKGRFLKLDTGLTLIWDKNDIQGSWVFNIRTDTLFNRLQYTNTVPYLAGMAIYSDTIQQSSTYFPNDGDYRLISGFALNSNDSMIIFGYKDSLNQTNYWIAKISGVGDEWIPDRCSYQPPVAGFEFEYNYPLLTLRDTSTGGLKYLDTVYTWQWTTSAGATGNDDSLQVLFDTAVSKTLDVELVISNWYGCTDTVSTTLDFTSTGIKEYLELEVKVFPNPTKDILNVHLGDYSGKVEFTLYDLHGSLISTQILISDQSVVPLKKVPQGLYFYEITNSKNVVRGKVVRE